MVGFFNCIIRGVGFSDPNQCLLPRSHQLVQITSSQGKEATKSSKIKNKDTKKKFLRIRKDIPIEQEES